MIERYRPHIERESIRLIVPRNSASGMSFCAYFGMVTYEITAQVRPDLVRQYEAYMQDRHIADVLATGFFASASFSRSSEGRYLIRYESFDLGSLDQYLATRAAELRKHFTDHFPGGIELSRENWSVLQSWHSTKSGQ
jgi:hypothetical protein